MVQFIEPICAVLPISPSTYHRHRHQRTNPTRRSARAQRDQVLRVEIQRVYDSTSTSTAPGKSGNSCGGTASAWRVVPWRTLEAVEFATLTWVD